MGGQRSIKLSFSTAFQIRYCLVMVAVLVTASLLLYLYMNQTLSGSYLESLRTLQRLEQKLPYYLFITALLQTLFVLILTLIINLLVSHQIAGPVFRYEDVLSRIREGRLPARISTRQNDQLKPMVDSLNEFNASLVTVYQGAREIHDRLEPMLARMDAPTEGEIRDLKRRIALVREGMGEFVGNRSEVY